MTSPNYNIVPGEIYSLGVDASQHLDATAVKDSVYSTAIRYVTDGGEGLPQKQLMWEEAQALQKAGIALVSNYESDGRPGNGWGTGFDDARVAMGNHIAAGGPLGATVYFSLDYDAPESDQDLINEYIHGIYDCFAGTLSVGLYAGYWVCLRARERYPHLKIWQTEAWSGGNVLPDIEILQRAQQDYVGGVQCDVNEIRKPGKIGAWQDVNSITSLVDGEQYSAEQMIGFIDMHTDKTYDTINGLSKKVDAIIAHFGIVVPQ